MPVCRLHFFGARRFARLVALTFALAACSPAATIDGGREQDAGEPRDSVEGQCRWLGGTLLPGVDPTIRIRGGVTRGTVVLPGSDWCETAAPPGVNPYPGARYFVNMVPRVELLRATPTAIPQQMHFVGVEVAPQRIREGAPSDLTAQRGELRDVLAGRSPSSPGSPFIRVIPRLPLGFRGEAEAADPESRCLGLSITGAIAIAVPQPSGSLRRFETRGRWCYGPPGEEAIVFAQLLQEWTADDPEAPRRLQAYRLVTDRLLDSITVGDAP